MHYVLVLLFGAATFIILQDLIVNLILEDVDILIRKCSKRPIKSVVTVEYTKCQLFMQYAVRILLLIFCIYMVKWHW